MFQYSLSWNNLHPIVAHISIILLLTAPTLVLVGIGRSPVKKRLCLGSALAIMVLGTAAAFVASAIGESATRVIVSPPAFKSALEEHRALAETTRELFLVLTLGFAALLFAPRLLRSELESYINTALLAVYLIFYATGALFLVHTGLQGGRTVRELQTKMAATDHFAGKENVR